MLGVAGGPHGTAGDMTFQGIVVIGVQAARGAGVRGVQTSRAQGGQTDRSADRGTVYLGVGIIAAGCVGCEESDAAAARMREQSDPLRAGGRDEKVEERPPRHQVAEAVRELPKASSGRGGLTEVWEKVQGEARREREGVGKCRTCPGHSEARRSDLVRQVKLPGLKRGEKFRNPVSRQKQGAGPGKELGNRVLRIGQDEPEKGAKERMRKLL